MPCGIYEMGVLRVLQNTAQCVDLHIIFVHTTTIRLARLIWFHNEFWPILLPAETVSLLDIHLIMRVFIPRLTSLDLITAVSSECSLIAIDRWRNHSLNNILTESYMNAFSQVTMGYNWYHTIFILNSFSNTKPRNSVSSLLKIEIISQWSRSCSRRFEDEFILPSAFLRHRWDWGLREAGFSSDYTKSYVENIECYRRSS